jgi:hypothetical protein
LALITFSCQQSAKTQESTQRQVYDYSVSVEETAMGQPLTILAVQSGVTVPRVYRGHAHAYLIVYGTIYPIEQADPDVLPRIRLVPQDTLAIALTRHQTDTIYTLARRVFMPPPAPPARDSLKPPIFYQTHDTDPYVLIRFLPRAYNGPTYVCSGYKEGNLAGYTLRAYLLKLKQQHLQHAQ